MSETKQFDWLDMISEFCFGMLLGLLIAFILWKAHQL